MSACSPFPKTSCLFVKGRGQNGNETFLQQTINEFSLSVSKASTE